MPDLDIDAIAARVTEFQAARAAITGAAASRERYHAALMDLDLHREDDLRALVAEVRRLRHCAVCGTDLDENYCVSCD